MLVISFTGKKKQDRGRMMCNYSSIIWSVEITFV